MLVASAVIVATMACSRAHDNGMRDSSAGTVATPARDSGFQGVSVNTPSASPLVHVTKTDARSVAQATRFEITEANLRKYMVASESLSVLAARDPGVKRIADNANLTGAGSPDANAGLKLLESNAAANATINNQGLSVRDFFVMSIAIASAERFMNDPKAAPPTPTLTKNAELLRRHQEELRRIQALAAGPAITATP